MKILEEYGIKRGLGKGFRTFLWLLKVMVPVSLIVAVMEWSGLLAYVEFALRPLMSLLSLPPEAALPIIAGLTVGPGASIAAMVVLPLTQDQMTLMAIFILIAHGFPQESVIQGKAGFNPIKASVIRLVAAVLTVMAVAPFLDLTPMAGAGAAALSKETQTFQAMIMDWLGEMAHLALFLLTIVMVLMSVLEAIRTKGWIDHVVRFLSPVLRALGLNPQAGVLWVAAAFFGLGFGSAVLVEEANSGRISQEDLETLHISIGINHGMFDDPSLFLSLGLNPFWIYVPRLLMAILAVRLLTLWRMVRRRMSAA